MRRITAFGHFCWEFVVGDDWRVGAASAGAVGLTALLAHLEIVAWWFLPPAVAIILYASLRGAARG